MKKIVFSLIAIALTISLVSCNKPDETLNNNAVPELSFSVYEREVYTDGIEYSFDILSGGGGYKAEVCLVNDFDEYAAATVSGNKVTVKLVANVTQVKVTDKSGQQKDLIIWSTNSSLQTMNYDIAMGYGFQNKGKFTFGSGEGYSIVKSIHPGYAELIVNENGEYVANSLHTGTTSFYIRDSRGTVNYAQVSVWLGWDLEEDNLTVDVEVGDQYTFVIKWGEGTVKISDCSDELKNAWLLIDNKNQFGKNRVLQACVNNGSTGEFFVELTDSAKNKAKIILKTK